MSPGKRRRRSPKRSALVYLETFGNQRYIFATNRLRQNVGASQLTHLTGTQWVLDALGRDVAGAGVDNETLRTHLLSPEGNPPLEDEDRASAEIVYAVSGKALVLVDTPEQGRELLAAVTQRALIEAPGLEVVGAVGEEFQWDPQKDGGELHRRIGAVAQRQVALRAHLLGPGARGPRLPITASCDSSGQPAVQRAPWGDGWELRSREVASKHRTTCGPARSRCAWRRSPRCCWWTPTAPRRSETGTGPTASASATASPRSRSRR